MPDPEKVRQVLEPLEKLLEEEYLQEDLVRQREALFELLGSLGSRIGTLRNAFGFSREKRSELFRPIDEWCACNLPLFPGVIQASIRVIHASASACLQDHALDQINSTGAREFISFHWSVLEGYDALLRRRLVKAQREGTIRPVESPDPTSSPSPEASHSVGREELTLQEQPFQPSADYRCVILRGKKFELTMNQARVVEELHAAYRRGVPVISDAHLLEKLEIKSERLRDVFKNSSAWGVLVVQGEKQGTRRLGI